MEHAILHVIMGLIKKLQKQTMRLVMLLNGEKTNYLIVPEVILSEKKSDFIFRTFHFFITIIFACFIVIKILPFFSTYFTDELEMNSSIIPLTIFLSLVPASLIIGVCIELILNLTNSEYLEYKQQLKQDYNNY